MLVWTQCRTYTSLKTSLISLVTYNWNPSISLISPGETRESVPGRLVMQSSQVLILSQTIFTEMRNSNFEPLEISPQRCKRLVVALTRVITGFKCCQYDKHIVLCKLAICLASDLIPCCSLGPGHPSSPVHWPCACLILVCRSIIDANDDACCCCRATHQRGAMEINTISTLPESGPTTCCQSWGRDEPRQSQAITWATYIEYHPICFCALFLRHITSWLWIIWDSFTHMFRVTSSLATKLLFIVCDQDYFNGSMIFKAKFSVRVHLIYCWHVRLENKQHARLRRGENENRPKQGSIKQFEMRRKWTVSKWILARNLGSIYV